ncbi:MAG: hypothetical protein JWM43_1129 [Acidobacteriaceae bacterium]|nr:hypothetical protein [Acidobacteriaceae bacterium]
MFRRCYVVIPRSTAHLAKRLAQQFSKQQLIRIARLMGPTLVALSFAGVAHAQGTMDFSGATTLMTTFNMSPPSIQAPIVFSDGREVVPKQSVRSFDSQREHVRNLKQHAQSRVISGAPQVRQQVLGEQFTPFEGVTLPVVRWPDLAMQVAKMNKSAEYLGLGYISIHSEGAS